MLDIKLFLNHYETTVEKLQRKKVDTLLLEKLSSLAFATKKTRQELEEAQSIQNEKSRLFGEYKRKGEDTTALKVEVDANKEKIASLQMKTDSLATELDVLLLQVPNLPDENVPLGADEEENIEIKKVLEPRDFSFEPKEHWELGENLAWIDFERGAKLAKSRFSVLKSDAARLERALANYMLDFNRERGFEEVSVPLLVNRETMIGTGQLPKFEEDLFKIDDERELFLIPTAEVPLTNLFADEILSSDELPYKMTALTPCFRKEAGSAGRDTRGMIRQHQFYKVELVSIVHPEQSENVLHEMVTCASDLLTSLGLPHRLVRLCTGDLGFSAAQTIDIEVWLPGQKKYREISSVSNCRDFQARRAKIRYKEGKMNKLVHTLNGSSLAVGRTLIAIMENYQNEDGTVTIPDVLKPYIK